MDQILSTLFPLFHAFVVYGLGELDSSLHVDKCGDYIFFLENEIHIITRDFAKGQNKNRFVLQLDICAGGGGWLDCTGGLNTRLRKVKIPGTWKIKLWQH